MDLQLRGRTILVAGAGRGIGRGVALALAAEGANLVLCGRDEGRLAAVLAEVAFSGGEAVPVAGDLRDPEIRKRAVEIAAGVTGLLHGVVNTAGGAAYGDPFDLPVGAFEAALAAKFLVQFDLARIAATRMRDQPEGGVVINIVGIGGVEPFTTHLPGGAANAALLLATKGLARRAAEDGVRVLGLSPGLVATERMTAVVAANAERDGIEDALAAQRLTEGIPLGRMADVEDVASAVTFLLSPRAGYFTGCHIVLDGGQTHAI